MAGDLHTKHVSLAIPSAQPVIGYVDSIREPTLAFAWASTWLPALISTVRKWPRIALAST